MSRREGVEGKGERKKRRRRGRSVREVEREDEGRRQEGMPNTGPRVGLGPKLLHWVI